MCTVSWSFRNQSCRVFFNRDERRSRLRAERPRQIEWRGAELIAPIDPQGGGSWIALNRAGIVAFLLNNYAAIQDDSALGRCRSRGEIPLSIASRTDFAACVEALETLDTERYRPFIAGVVSPSGESHAIAWDGMTLKLRDLTRSFLTTSSFRFDAVESYRRARYEELIRSGGADWAWSHGLNYHQDLNNADPAFNPLMSREDAETHCISVITATPEGTQFEYLERIENSDEFLNAGSWSFGE